MLLLRRSKPEHRVAQTLSIACKAVCSGLSETSFGPFLSRSTFLRMSLTALSSGVA